VLSAIRLKKRGRCAHAPALLTRQVVLHTPATYPLLLETGVANAPGVDQQQQQQQQLVPAVQQEQGGTSLLDKGNMYGLTALHVAVCMGRAEAAGVLLEV